MQDIYISIGQNIRRRRKEKHLTQESLAANVETSAQYISRIERGQVCPSLEFLYRLSAALECPIYSLLPSTAPSASTSFFSQELASQLNSCTPQQQQFLMSFISWFLQQSTPFSEFRSCRLRCRLRGVRNGQPPAAFPSRHIRVSESSIRPCRSPQ